MQALLYHVHLCPIVEVRKVMLEIDCDSQFAVRVVTISIYSQFEHEIGNTYFNANWPPDYVCYHKFLQLDKTQNDSSWHRQKWILATFITCN